MFIYFYVKKWDTCDVLAEVKLFWIFAYEILLSRNIEHSYFLSLIAMHHHCIS